MISNELLLIRILGLVDPPWLLKFAMSIQQPYLTLIATPLQFVGLPW